MAGIHQLLPGFTGGDAISNEAEKIRDIIKNWGYESNIFTISRHTSPKMRSLCLDYTEYEKYSSKDNIVIYHYSIGSVLTKYFKQLPDKKIIIYHNITPDRYFMNINTEKATVLRQGREQLRELAGTAGINLADSLYNCHELEGLGFRNVHELPILLDFDVLSGKPKQKILNKYKDGLKNLLFVGRVTPNKRIEDVIKVFYYFKKTININSRLFIAGSFVGMERYCDYLRAITLELDLPNVVFTGHIDLSELLAYYRLSDMFVCMSEHEGFCIPLVESMYFNVPIIAYNAAAVPYTLGKSGMLVNNKDYPKIAELMGMVLSSDRLRNEIITKQRERLDYFTISNIEEKFKGYIKEIL